MASFSPGSSHLGVTDNQKRWLVAGIALNKILIPQIRPFVEQEVDKEYNNLKTSHNIHTQSTSGRLQRWPPRKFLKYENVNGNDLQPKLPSGRYNYSLFDCRVLSHTDFGRLYVENYMAKFNAFDDHCDASAVLLLLGGVPVFSAAVQAAAGDVRTARNDWAHCVFGKWDPTKFQQSFIEMEHLVRVMALPAADEGKLLGELKDWETKGIQLCMNSPVDPALLQLVQQNIKSLQDDVNNMSAEFDQEKVKVQQELQNVATILKETRERIQRLEDKVDDFQGDTNQWFESLESRTGQVENQVHNLQEKFDDLTVKSQESASWHDPPVAKPVANPEKFVELIGRDYKSAVLCPFPWCEDELQMKLSNIFTRLLIKSRTKERSKLTDNTINMTDVFIPHAECVNPRVVLIEGNPGMGKTTYCQKLAYDWSVGEIPPKAWFPKVEMLLLLKCRDMHMKTASIEAVIDDQLLPQDADKKEKENFFHFIRSNQSRILLVVDGLDELRQDLVKDFLPLIQGKVFSNIYLLLTARHEAGMRIRRYCDTLLEIVGYTHDDADNYIERYFSNHEDKSLAGKMINQLNKDKQLRELTANPLNTALLCLLYDETRGVFSSKKTKLYDDLVSCGLRRYFAKSGVSLDDDDPVERCADQLNQLGKIAFEAFLKHQLYFSQDEMNCQSTDFLQLPFLSREPSVSKIRPKPCFAFTHKTLQEYFAAFYLAHQILTGDKGIETLLAQLSPVDSWQVWEFLLTMVSSKRSEMAVFVVSRLCAFFYGERPQNTIHAFANADDDWDNFELCELKAHDWTVCLERWSADEVTLGNVVNKTLHLIAECEDGENELKDYQKKMVHVLARCFPVKKLALAPSARYRVLYSEYLKTNCTLTYLRLESDLNELLLSTIEDIFHPGHKLVFLKLMNVNIVLPLSQLDSTIADLRRRKSWFERFGAQAITTFLQSYHLLTHVDLSNVSVHDEGAIAVAQFIHTNRNLTHLSLCNADIFDPEAIQIAYALQLNCTLTHLSLSRNWITGFGANALANGTLQYLDLSDNVDGESVAQGLALVLESNRVLSYLDVGQSFEDPLRCMSFLDSGAIKTINICTKLIGPSGASALARTLRVNCSLTYLDVKYNNIRDSGAAAFGKALQANCILSQLDLSGNMIGDLGAAYLGEALQSNSTLTLLYLMDNKIGDPGAEALGKALQSNRSLTHLNIQANHIGDLGTAAFAKALQSTGIQLTHLDMALNKISSLGAIALAEALQSNSSLTGLELGNNKIESSGAAALAEALQSNCTLMHLMVSSNGVTDLGVTELAKALQYNNCLIYLNVEHNPFGLQGEENLERVDQSKCVVKYYSSLGAD